jgi:Flp pilus assembly pilin Flp
MRTNRGGQSTIEYGIMIGAVVLALVAMQAYLKRGLQGFIKGQTDAKIGAVGYEDKNYRSESNESLFSSRGVRVDQGGVVNASSLEIGSASFSEASPDPRYEE